MLEFNVDKKAGIQLHTCERKSRWCKVFLMLSWLLLLGLLGWLFWKGLFNSATLGTAVSPSSQAIQSIADCKTSSEANRVKTNIVDTTALTEKNKQSLDALTLQNKKACDQQLSALESKLKQQLSEQYSKKLKAAEDALKTTKRTLADTQQQLKKEKSKLTPEEQSADVVDKLFFYEKIMRSNGVQNAVFVNHFAANATKQPRHYRFQLILARLGDYKNTTGTYEIFLKGFRRTETKKTTTDSKTKKKQTKVMVKREPVTFKHTDLLPAEAVSGQNTFAFKYYKILEGEFVLPKNYELESLTVNVNPQGLSSVRNKYDWNNLKQQAFKKFKREDN